MADSLFQIVLFRTLQGLAGAALLPLSQAILLDINPKERHGRAMAIWGMGVVLGPILGPLLGGWLTEDYSWRWVFFVNVPFGILAAVGIAATLHEAQAVLRHVRLRDAEPRHRRAADDARPRRAQDWFSSTEIQVEAFIAVLGLFLFIVHTATTENTFISRGLFKDRNFVIGNVFIFMIGVVLFATLALMPPMLQGLMGISGAGRRARHRTAGRWHLGFDGGRRPPHWQGRFAPADRDRVRPGRHLAMADGRASRRRSTRGRSSGPASSRVSAPVLRMSRSPSWRS
ncbi:MAG: MFS transporter [Gammaproteobacteria bacterium]